MTSAWSWSISNDDESLITVGNALDWQGWRYQRGRSRWRFSTARCCCCCCCCVIVLLNVVGPTCRKAIAVAWLGTSQDNLNGDRNACSTKVGRTTRSDRLVIVMTTHKQQIQHGCEGRGSNHYIQPVPMCSLKTVCTVRSIYESYKI